MNIDRNRNCNICIHVNQVSHQMRSMQSMELLIKLNLILKMLI